MNQHEKDRIRKNLRMVAMKCGLPDDAAIGVKAVITDDFTIEKEANTGRDEYVAIATTEDIDLDGEVVVASGLTKTYLERNRKLFCDHEYGMADVVGSIRTISAYPTPQDHRGWKVRISLNETPMGVVTRKIIEDSGHIGLSIGFTVNDRGPATQAEREKYRQGGKEPASIVRSGDWFELSATPMPCNVSCQTGQVIRAGKAIDIISDMVAKGLLTRSEAEMVGFEEAAVRKFWAVDVETGIQSPIRA